jgi:hypothetical protein
MERLLDGEKLHRDMSARFANLYTLILKDYNGDPAKIEAQYWELKYWKEALERGAYDVK